MIDLVRLFSSRRNALAGLDIARDAVRMVELSCTKSGVLTLERYGSESLRADAVSDDGIEDLEHVIAAAQRLWQKTGCQAGKVAIGIPDRNLVMHTFSIPGEHDETALTTLAREHIAPLLDYHVDDACVDCCILDHDLQTPKPLKLLVAAARQESVGDRLAIAESLGLQVTVADADSCAAHVALTRAMVVPANDALVLFHLDGRDTQLVMYDHGGGVHTDHYAGPADALASTLEQQAATATQQLQALRHGTQPHQLLLSGTGAMTPGLAAAFQQHTGIATAVANPFRHMQLATGIDATQLAAEASAYVVACGLALRRFD